MEWKKLTASVEEFLFMIRKQKNTEEPSLKKFSLFIPFVFLIAVLAGFFWWRWGMSALSLQSSTMSKTFVVRKGESLSSVAGRLQEESLIHNSLIFKILILKDGLAGKIQAGSFRLNSSLRPQEIADILTHGTEDIWLTFPEGWRKEEFAQRLVANLEKFDVDGFLKITASHEGELFPDTYLLPREASPSAVFNLLLNNFQKKFDKKIEDDLSGLGLTKKEALILASLVEREARNDQDRPIIAGILIKRLKANWPLQIDATLQYVLADLNCQKQNLICDWWPDVTITAKQINSPYNTYKNRGLPPTPICNPGLASIKAVVYPQETDFWFYLSDKTGKMHYAKTAEEHNENINQYL